MEKYFPYDISSPQKKSGEVHTITGGTIRLRHVPKENSIQISGFTQADSPASLQFNEFYCRYASDTLYRDSNRIVNFSNLRNGSTVSVDYYAVGTVVTADDMNEIKAHMENTDGQFVNVNFALTQHANDILNLQNQIAGLNAADIDAHDQSHNAHQFIQGLILTEESARTLADDNLATQINSKMTFAGTSTAFPQNPSAGWLAIVNDAPYLFDGTQWTLLKGATEFLLGSESSTVEGSMWISIS